MKKIKAFLQDLWIINNFKDWGEDGSEYWWPTMIWLQLEIYEFELFKICFDFWEFTFDIYLFGFGFKIWLFDKVKFRFHKSKIDMKNKRVQLVVSCAIYWHFFQVYNDCNDRFIEILGFRA